MLALFQDKYHCPICYNLHGDKVNSALVRMPPAPDTDLDALIQFMERVLPTLTESDWHVSIKDVEPVRCCGFADCVSCCLRFIAAPVS